MTYRPATDVETRLLRALAHIDNDLPLETNELHNELIDRVIRRIADLEAQLAQAEKWLQQWCHSAGWSTGHGDTLADIVREMLSQHCDERSERDLIATNMDDQLAKAQERRDVLERAFAALGDAMDVASALDAAAIIRTAHEANEREGGA